PPRPPQPPQAAQTPPVPAAATATASPTAQPAAPTTTATPVAATTATPTQPASSAAAAAASQIAALPPSAGPSALPAQVTFAPNTSDTPDQAKATLDRVITAMKADEQIHVQLVAYASGSPDQASQARRISLQRAISVRSYLMEHGVKSARIDVRALGNRTDVPGPQDRVDVVATDR